MGVQFTTACLTKSLPLTEALSWPISRAIILQVSMSLIHEWIWLCLSCTVYYWLTGKKTGSKNLLLQQINLSILPLSLLDGFPLTAESLYIARLCVSIDLLEPISSQAPYERWMIRACCNVGSRLFHCFDNSEASNVIAWN